MTYRIKFMLTTLAVAAASACVTINVYFPEAAAERAADRFIQDVLGEQAVPGAPETGGGFASNGGLLDFFIASAHAQANINIDTPQINAIKQRMAERQRSHLAAWFDAGAIGLDNRGLVSIRDQGAVPMADRRNLQRIVNEENNDRNAVYREIAVANGRPEWESDIRETFARQWVSNARSGWQYQDAQGSWQTK